MVLEHCQAGSGLQLLVVQGQQVSLSLLNLVKHLFSELLSGLNLVSLALIDFQVAFLLLLLQLVVFLFDQVLKALLFLLELLHVVGLILKLFELLLE